MSEELGGSSGGATGGGSSGGTVAGGAGGAGAGVAVNGGASALTRMVRGTLPEHGHVSPSTGGEIDYLRTAWGTDHEADVDPHPGYATDTDLATHEAAADPHSQYATDTDVADHLAAADPHPAYATDADLAGYATADHTHPSEESGPWRFQDNTTIANPGAGYMRCNTGNLATATILSLSRTTQDGYDIPPPGWGLAADDTVYVQDRDDSTKWVRYTALEPLVRYPTYATGLVAVTGSAGSIANGQIVQVTFSLAGGGGGGAGGGLATDELWDAKGDLAVATGADAAARLAVGTNGQLLGANSATASGLEWVANPVTAHTALPDAHHAQAHDHTAADGSGALSNEEHDGYSQYANLGADPATPATNRIRVYSKDNGSGIATLYYRTESGTIYEIPTLTGGGNGSGAPSNASYVTLSAENKLSAETALGAGVIMAGTAAARPAAGTAGRLYLATDTGTVTRDSGSTWVAFAQASPKTYVQSSEPASPATGDLWVW